MSGFVSLPFLIRVHRRRPPFDDLRAAPWHVFVALAAYWQSGEDAWPSQATLGALCGYHERTVRSAMAELTARGLVAFRRSYLPDGTSRLHYAPGEVALSALAEPRSEVPPDRGSAPPEPRSAPDRIDDPPTLLVNQQQQGGETSPGDESREIARAALVGFFERCRPGQPPLRIFAGEDVELVARCVAATEGDREAKLQAMRDAVEGAFEISRRAPTVRFVWGRIEHYAAHTDRGRRRRAEKERGDATRAARATQTVKSDEAKQDTAPVAASRSHVPRAQLASDLERLFGAGWRERK